MFVWVVKLEKLGMNERKLLRGLNDITQPVAVPELARHLHMDQAAMMRAVMVLREGGLLELEEKKIQKLFLLEEGKKYAEVGLPEKRLLRAVVNHPRMPVNEIPSLTDLESSEIPIALAWVKKNQWVRFEREGAQTFLVPTEAGVSASKKETEEELVLKSLRESPKNAETLNVGPETIERLKRRELVKIEEKTLRWVSLTEHGRKLAATVEEVEEITELTKEEILSRRWKRARLKRYDISVPCPPVYPVKIHPQQVVIDEIREILLEMGFIEIKSRVVESEFWNFDALFQAQEHPAREIHDSLSVKRPSKTRLPPKELVDRVKQAHERGVGGSTGWRYDFDVKISSRPVLCSQTTAATVRFLATKPQPPVKVFCIDRVYRHEKIDYKHLAEFYQCEGIVMEKGLTLKDMLGYLKLIVNKLGLEKIRFRPGYFPYTEPSVEADVYFPQRGEWIEVLGAGMFRPELLIPLGIKHPVLAWGIGFSRLAMVKLGIDDIRDLYSCDLEWIRRGRVK